MVDFRATLYDGKYHDVDSSDMAFKIAGSLAFKEAMKQAKPALLEPVMHVEVYAPDQYSGDIMGDLSSRRGRISGSEARGASVVIKAQVPFAEMLNYATGLTSMTQGRASYSMEFSHYDYVPERNRGESDRRGEGGARSRGGGGRRLGSCRDHRLERRRCAALGRCRPFDLKGGLSIARRFCDRTRIYLLGAPGGKLKRSLCPYLHIPLPYEHGRTGSGRNLTWNGTDFPGP